MPSTAPESEPAKTPARVSFDQVTVSAIGMTAGLRTTPLFERYAARKGVVVISNITYSSGRGGPGDTHWT